MFGLNSGASARAGRINSMGTSDMQTNGKVNVDLELMAELLNATTRTALAHRNDVNEMYVLGQMEATANIIYVLSVSQGFDGLESICQRMALDALARFAEITGKPGMEELDDAKRA